MLKSIEGVYRDGKVELVEQPSNISDATRVIVTFLEPGNIDLKSRGIGEARADDLRSRLLPFAEDWNDPAMSMYDNYDAAKS